MKKKINPYIFSLIIGFICFCTSASADVIDRIVAVVNTDIITLVELNRETLPFFQKIKTSGYSSEKKKEMLAALKAQDNLEIVAAEADEILFAGRHAGAALAAAPLRPVGR